MYPGCSEAGWRADRFTNSFRTGFFWFLVLNQLLAIPLHAARRAMAAASPLPLAAISREQETTNKRQSFAFPPVYPFPTPGPACAVIVGVSPRSPSPHSAYNKRKEKKRTDDGHTRKEKGQKHSESRAPTPPCPPPIAPPLPRHQTRPPIRPRRPGPQHQEFPSSSPSVAGAATSTPWLGAGRSSWPRRHPPALHEDLHNSRTSP